MPAGGSLHPPSHETIDQRLHYVKQDGRAVFAMPLTTEVAIPRLKPLSLSFPRKSFARAWSDWPSNSGTFEKITYGTTLATLTDLSASGGDFDFEDTTTIHDTVRTQIPTVAAAAVYTFENLWDIADPALIERIGDSAGVYKIGIAGAGENGNATGQFGQAFLQFFFIKIRSGFFYERLDFINARLNVERVNSLVFAVVMESRGVYMSTDPAVARKYGEGLLAEVASDGRIHATFNQTVARTGRLSSDAPNLHNIPVRSEVGRQFRKAFVPTPGTSFLVADYNQIELRCIAHLAEDPGLVEAFTSGRDIHNQTASRVFGVDPADVALLVPHQANTRIIASACDKLGFRRDQTALVLHSTGNTSAASIPLALAEALEGVEMAARRGVDSAAGPRRGA